MNGLPRSILEPSGCPDLSPHILDTGTGKTSRCTSFCSRIIVSLVGEEDEDEEDDEE